MCALRCVLCNVFCREGGKSSNLETPNDTENHCAVFVTDTKGLLRLSHLTLPSVKVSPEAHSTPNMATMSPALAEEMSSSSLACMRTSRGTFTQIMP